MRAWWILTFWALAFESTPARAGTPPVAFKAPEVLKASTGSEDPDHELAVELDLLRKRMQLNRAMGFTVSRLDTGEVIYEHNASRPFVPASGMKLITMAAAIHYLGPNHRFETRFFSSGSFRDGVLTGNLVVQGRGDPVLDDGELTEAAQGLLRAGLREVRGDIVLDDGYFDDGARGASGILGALDKGLPLTSAVAYQFNHVEVGVTAGEKKGRPAVLRETGYGYMEVVNRALTVSTGQPWIRLTRIRGKNKIVVNGRVRPGDPEVVGGVLATDPIGYLGSAVAGKLRAHGIRVTGEVRKGTLPAGAALVYAHQSPPLMQILELLGKNSNNFVAEQVIKALGAERFGAPGSLEKGARALGDYLKELGFQDDEFRIFDGSGLSYDNRLTADILLRVLSELYRSELREDFLCVLALGGVDGTLKRRLRDESHLGMVVAKTGSLSGISSLSGFAFSPTRGPLVFSILLNGIGRQWRGDRAEDAIAKLLLRP